MTDILVQVNPNIASKHAEDAEHIEPVALPDDISQELRGVVARIRTTPIGVQAFAQVLKFSMNIIFNFFTHAY